MLRLDLAANLLSEAVGILATVLLVDRVIAWRRRRRWRQVELSFLHVADDSCKTMLAAWRDWLIFISGRETEAGGLVRVSAVVMDPSGRDLEQAYRPELEAALGAPVGSRVFPFAEAADAPARRRVSVQLVPHLLRRMFPPGSWRLSTLAEQLSPRVQALADQLGRFGALVDPDPGFALPIIRLSLFAERLRGHVTNEQQRSEWEGELEDLFLRWLVEDMIEGLEQTMSLYQRIQRGMKRVRRFA